MKRRKRDLITWTSLPTALGCAFLWWAHTSAASQPTPLPTAPPDGLTVTRWVDGDTAACGDDCRVRLLGINTPERGEPGYREATDWAEHAAPVGSRIVLPSSRKDRYGRWLGYVVTSSGDDYGLTAIVAGTAVPCYDHEPPVSSLCPGSGGYPAHEMGDAYHDAWEQWGR